jgi:hypothetical protein
MRTAPDRCSGWEPFWKRGNLCGLMRLYDVVSLLDSSTLTVAEDVGDCRDDDIDIRENDEGDDQHKVDGGEGGKHDVLLQVSGRLFRPHVLSMTYSVGGCKS